jgi:ElaB/YqjD/DUF883 family membrane-anchored ribosome-binding protein
MAHQSPIVPIRKQRNEPVSWPSSEETASPALPAAEAAVEQAKDLYRTSVVAAERSVRDVRRKVSRVTPSVVNAVRAFANERPLHAIAIVAGAFFAAGVALRIWRSKRDA